MKRPVMTRIPGVSGSLRAGWYKAALLRAAQRVADPMIELEVATLYGSLVIDRSR